MTERTPEFRVEIIIKDDAALDEREQIMRDIVDLVNRDQFVLAQELVNTSGIKYSEAINWVYRSA
jgi:hypothetical protein